MTIAEWTAYKRHLATSRRELRKAVEKFASITDPLPGHRIHAVRLAREVRDEAEKAVQLLEERR